MNGSEILVKALRNEGVTKIFGISGHGVAAFLEAVRRESGIDFISTRHEENAAHMADGWARTTGQVGVCVSTVGPGAINQVAGISEAFADSIPVVAITANVQSFFTYPSVGFFEDMDSLALYRPVTKWNAVVHQRGRLVELVQRAFREARVGRPGPVHLDIPLDVLCEEGDDADLLPPEAYRAFARPKGEPASVEKAVKLLQRAERPLLVAGGGVVASGAADEFRSLARALGAPSTTTPMGAGCVDSKGDCYFGDSGWLGGNPVIQALNRADVILAVGCRFTAWLGIGRPPVMAGSPAQKVIHVDIDPREIGKHVPIEVGIVGDARLVLADMLAAVGESGGAGGRYDAWKRELTTAYQEYMASLEPMLGPPQGPMTQARLAKEVGDFLADKDALFTVDGGSTLLWAFTHLRAYEPGRRFFFANGGHLGCGQPIANALQLANPGRLVVNFCGDGGFGMTMQEFDTAIRHKLPRDQHHQQ